MGKSGRKAERKGVQGGRGAGGSGNARGEGAADEPSRSDAEQPSFEAALEQLERTVSRLEEGDLPLEEALELFEAGVDLSRRCSATLEEAERRVEILVADRGVDPAAGEAPESIPFESDEDWDDDELDEDPED